MKKQVFNPYLPLWEYVPDGEPHVFGNRLYVFGSHDVEGGTRYCAGGNYVGWSAPTDDLTDWRYEGELFNASQDPRVSGEFCDLYAPDVVQGNDGKYYLYYAISGGIGGVGDDHNTPCGVAVCDTPAGKYEYLGFLRNPDGSPYLRYLPGDPAVINDNGVIRLYHGWALSLVSGAAHGGSDRQRRTPNLDDLKRMEKSALRRFLLQAEQMLFHRTEEQLMSEPEDVMGANHVILDDDMLTVISEPARIIPSQFMALGTGFEGHGFYEASSIRKIGGTYYFIYSDENSNMLSYATSRYPDRDFVYRGILNSNGDVGLNGREGRDRLNMTANNHGSLECVNGQWYIFYHRQTHNSTYSRQGCAEKVTIQPDGSIAQAECTSCGLNDGPLIAEGTFPAPICCNLTNGNMPHATNRIVGADIPYITHSGEGETAERYITNLKEGSIAVYKYFAFSGSTKLTVKVRGSAGTLEVRIGSESKAVMEVPDSDVWNNVSCTVEYTQTAALTFAYHGEGALDILELNFQSVF